MYKEVTDANYDDPNTLIQNHWATDINKTGVYIITTSKTIYMALIYKNANAEGAYILIGYSNATGGNGNYLVYRRRRSSSWKDPIILNDTFMTYSITDSSTSDPYIIIQNHWNELTTGFYYIASATVFYTAIVFHYGSDYGSVICMGYAAGASNQNYLSYYRKYAGTWYNLDINDMNMNLGTRSIYYTSIPSKDMNNLRPGFYTSLDYTENSYCTNTPGQPWAGIIYCFKGYLGYYFQFAKEYNADIYYIRSCTDYVNNTWSNWQTIQTNPY